MFNSIGSQHGIGAPLGIDGIGGENFIRHIGNDKLIYDFKEGSGTTVRDKSHCGNDGTLTNTGDLTWLRNEIVFGGTNGHINCGHDSSFDITDNITVEVHVKSITNNKCGLISKREEGVDDVWSIYVDNEDKILNSIWTISGRQDFDITSSTIKNGDIITFTYNLALGKSYINHILEKSTAITGAILTGASDVIVGLALNTTLCFAGVMCMVRVISKTLSQIEIQQNYLANKFGGNN